MLGESWAWGIIRQTRVKRREQHTGGGGCLARPQVLLGVTRLCCQRGAVCNLQGSWRGRIGGASWFHSRN